MMHGLENPKFVVLFQSKINLRFCASGWFYYRNSLQFFVRQLYLLKIDCALLADAERECAADLLSGGNKRARSAPYH
jgi:hypothetical protein